MKEKQMDAKERQEKHDEMMKAVRVAKSEGLSIKLQAKYVPHGSTVTKLTGSVPYKAYKKFRIFNAQGETQEISADGGLILVNEGRATDAINIMDGEKYVLWILEGDSWELENFIQMAYHDDIFDGK